MNFKLSTYLVISFQFSNISFTVISLSLSLSSTSSLSLLSSFFFLFVSLSSNFYSFNTLTLKRSEEEDYLHFTLRWYLWERYVCNYSFYINREIVEPTGLFNHGMATALGEGNYQLKPVKLSFKKLIFCCIQFMAVEGVNTCILPLLSLVFFFT